VLKHRKVAIISQLNYLYANNECSSFAVFNLARCTLDSQILPGSFSHWKATKQTFGKSFLYIVRMQTAANAKREVWVNFSNASNNAKRKETFPWNLIQFFEVFFLTFLSSLCLPKWLSIRAGDTFTRRLHHRMICTLVCTTYLPVDGS